MEQERQVLLMQSPVGPLRSYTSWLWVQYAMQVVDFP